MFFPARKRILGIGNAAVDVISTIDSDEELDRLGLKKGHCVFFDDEQAKQLHAQIKDSNPEYVPGGSAANVLSCYRALGAQGRFIGKISDDECGRVFKKSMHDLGISYTTAPCDNGDGSTQIFTIVSADGERSFAAHYGASHVIDENDVSEEDIIASALLLIDGYMLMSNNGFNVLKKAVLLAKKHNRIIAFLPSDLSVIDEKRAETDYMVEHCDFLICNEEQALSLSHTDNVEEASKVLREDVELGAITMGEEGVYAFYGAEQAVKVSNPYQPDTIVSTNGAGDNFAGGLLYGILHDMPLQTACRIGMLCALEILKQQSPRPEASFTSLLEAA